MCMVELFSSDMCPRLEIDASRRIPSGENSYIEGREEDEDKEVDSNAKASAFGLWRGPLEKGNFERRGAIERRFRLPETTFHTNEHARLNKSDNHRVKPGLLNHY